MKPTDFAPTSTRAQLTLDPENVRTLSADSPFAGQFSPDENIAFVEFDICHSLPVVAGPTNPLGNFVGYHPGVLARSHGSLCHKQTNLQHLLKAYDPQNIAHDRIIGSVVATTFPPAPSKDGAAGTWEVPETTAEAPAIKVCAVVFKQAQGAQAMIDRHVTGQDKWSVSIESTIRSLDDLGIWIASSRKIVPFAEADETILSAITRTKEGYYVIGKLDGEQLVMALGSEHGTALFEGVGYTTRPAEKQATIQRILADEKVFDLEYARKLKLEWPSIWALGGGRSAESAFRALCASAKVGTCEDGKVLGTFLAERADFATREAAGTTLTAVVRQMHWGVIGALGEDGMKGVVEAEKARRRADRPAAAG